MQNQKFNVGDRVRVVDCQYGIRQMQQMLGNICTISEVTNCAYILAEDPTWLWKEEWLDLLEKPINISDLEFESLFKE